MVTGFGIGPAGLEPPARSRNRRKATVKVRRNPLLCFSFHDPKLSMPLNVKNSFFYKINQPILTQSWIVSNGI